MLYKTILITSLVAAASAQVNISRRSNLSFHKRQAFNPGEQTCKSNVPVGTTCSEACGSGYELCSDPADPKTLFCYNPGSLGESCCAKGTADAWSCPKDSFCLVDGFCCPNGEDPKNCAVRNGVTLPATFVAPTPTPVANPSGGASEPVTTPTDMPMSSPAPAPTSSGGATYSGAPVATSSAGDGGVPAHTAPAGYNPPAGSSEAAPASTSGVGFSNAGNAIAVLPGSAIACGILAMIAGLL